MESKIEMALPVEVELGSPLKDCLHFGICRIYAAENKKTPCACRCSAILYKLENGDIRFVFSKNNMAEKTWQKHFASGMFRVDDPYVFEKRILEKIGLEAFVIFPGKYRIGKKGENISLVFPKKDMLRKQLMRELAFPAH